LLTTTIEEGCIGETLAAMIAGEQASVALDARVKTAFDQIAADEARHAALAWRIVRWVLDRDPSLRSSARSTFERLLARAPALGGENPGVDAEQYRAHGRLSNRELARAHSEAITRVLRPCLERLFETSLSPLPCAAEMPASPAE